MIKVEIMEQENGIRTLQFESNDPNKDEDALDKILEAIVGPFPKRGAYVLGSKSGLKIDVNLKNSF